jgi:hypothetical protein
LRPGTRPWVVYIRASGHENERTMKKALVLTVTTCIAVVLGGCGHVASAKEKQESARLVYLALASMYGMSAHDAQRIAIDLCANDYDAAAAVARTAVRAEYIDTDAKVAAIRGLLVPRALAAQCPDAPGTPTD